MSCTDMEELISAYANGELHRTQREFVEEHLAGCPDCRVDLADHTWVGARLTSLKATPISSDIKERTMLKIEAIDTTRRPDPVGIAPRASCSGCRGRDSSSARAAAADHHRPRWTDSQGLCSDRESAVIPHDGLHR